uniref:Uncharacterized protein n=1 Tax=Magnetococcus massalia (strain MO-1) TaxID=451514 RepID=A0A1S7LF55_MAGMO|nr:conserved protein of unknown function[Include SEC-C motif domain] [Candidatus Magnetococcus massalia]
MAASKDLNDPSIYAEGLYLAALASEKTSVVQWLTGLDEPESDPLYTWHSYFADRLMELAPRPELGFRPRSNQPPAAPKIGRNDPCPCGSGKKFKQCHIDDAEAVSWKLGSPTPAIRAVAISRVVHELDREALDEIPRDLLSDLPKSEMAVAYHDMGEMVEGIDLLDEVLDGPREEEFLLYDYWLARFAEWLVEADRPKEAEDFLLDEYDNPRAVEAHQVAQKLAAFYLDQGDPDNAETWVNVTLEQDGENPFNYYLQGLMHHSMESWEKAIAGYEKALNYADNYREQEREAMVEMLQEALERAKAQQPVEETEEA